MLCRVEMPMNEQIYGRFYRYRLLHGGAALLGALLPTLIFALAAGGTFIMGGSLLLVLLFVVCACAIVGIQFYYQPTAAFRKRPGAALQTEVTIFTEKSLQRNVRGEEGGGGETASMQYAALAKAVETRRDFYLFTGGTDAYLVDKDCFTKGSPEALRAVLKAAMGDKFRGL